MSISTRVFGDKSASSVILFVGGSGDTKDSYNDLIQKLVLSFPHYKFVSFSFYGVEEHIDCKLTQQIEDLEVVLNTLIKDRKSQITLIATSNGAFSTTYAINNSRFNGYIKNVIFLDPADYYLDTDVLVKEARTWTGFQEYAPIKQTTSTLLHKISSDVRIHVVNFTIRNFSKTGYGQMTERGIDNEKNYARLNNKMVKSFYENTPKENKGLYIEDNSLPHAFMRDGDLKKNIQKIGEIVSQCLL